MSLIITPECNTTFAYIDTANSYVRENIASLVKTPYFRHFKLDLDKQCKFWNAQHFCATENCAVEVLPISEYDWEHVSNEDVRPNKLAQISVEDGTNLTCDEEYTFIDDGHECVYVDLVENPERFTGYGGTQSFDVWKAIYQENCFPETTVNTAFANGDVMNLTSSTDGICTEKQMFYRLVSGMHASIAVHLSNDYLNPETGEYYANLKAFMERVGAYNDRLSNIYFNYALVSSAIAKLNTISPVIDSIKRDEGKIPFDQLVDYEGPLDALTTMFSQSKLIDTSSLFDPEVVGPTLKDEFRARFRNVSAIMDCVGCDRCRMWGKVQTIGYGTALKILFETDEEKDDITFKRTELVALFNTFDRLSKSIESINNFKKLYLQHLDDVATGKATLGDYENSTNTFGFPFVGEAIAKGRSGSLPSSSSRKNSPPTSKEEGSTETSPINGEIATRLQWLLATEEVFQAIKFVLNSYVTLPGSVYTFIMAYVSQIWDKFVGRPDILFYGQTVHTIDGQTVQGPIYVNSDGAPVYQVL
ncbi:endoplasmic oxidoreductin-1 [Scheffersomyces spartinae]|uniref:Endoplasmic oxidoreductin-1 n=1 Tax=Scheffersomyces spartinae TaxID=45513 RepID=A0A9P7V4Y8_9ASCO|nr:endoplasmic oxidoreductin-1 [Scheffersomyces spartinae]KAG7191437.1 endoplasmic oxidoreductin-1 [Scheffersomyces spartinae]